MNEKDFESLDLKERIVYLREKNGIKKEDESFDIEAFIDSLEVDEEWEKAVAAIPDDAEIDEDTKVLFERWESATVRFYSEEEFNKEREK